MPSLRSSLQWSYKDLSPSSMPLKCNFTSFFISQCQLFSSESLTFLGFVSVPVSLTSHFPWKCKKAPMLLKNVNHPNLNRRLSAARIIPMKGTNDTDSINSAIFSLLSISFVNSQLVSLERITASQALGHSYNYRCGLWKAQADELIRNTDWVCWTVYLVWRTKSGRMDESPCKQMEQSPT